jgi:nitroreductase
VCHGASVRAMETWDAIMARRNVRAFADRPIPQPDLERVLQAGWAAPSAMNASTATSWSAPTGPSSRRWRRYGNTPATSQPRRPR